MSKSGRMIIILQFDGGYHLIQDFYPACLISKYFILSTYIKIRRNAQFILYSYIINFGVEIQQSIIIMLKTIFFAFILIFSFSLKELLRFPISFTIIRNLQLPQAFTKFQSDTGCCKSDSLTNVSSSYNLISLDGFSSASTVTSLQNSPTPLGLWLNAVTTIGGGKDQPSVSSIPDLQTSLLNKFHNSGNLLIFNALGRQAPISALKLSPTSIASNIINVLSSSNLDGVSIQFEDYHSVAKGTASQWLSTLLSTLRNQIGDKIIILIIPPTFLLRMDIFQDPAINAYVDFFVLKYFDTNTPTYNNYQSLFTQNTDYPKTSFMQLINNDSLWVDFCKVIIAKPASSNLARTSGNFIDGASLKTGFNQLYTNINWFGGYANLDFKTDTNLDFQRNILQDIRNNCFQDSNCICS